MSTAGVATDADVPATVAPPPRNPRFPLIDGLRAVAAGLVLVFHGVALADGHTGRLLHDLSQQGIAIFFVISGFLLYGPFVRARVRGDGLLPIRAYLRRRAVRIVPAYWLALTYAIAVAGATAITVGRLPIYYLLLQNYTDATRYRGLAVAWTLSIEATFYVLLPVLGYIAVKSAGLLRGLPRLTPESLIVAGFVVIAAGLHILRPGAPPTILDYTDWFAGGMGLALVTVRADRALSLPRSAAIVLWGAAALVFVCQLHTSDNGYGAHLLMVVCAVAVVVPAVAPPARGVVRATLELPALLWLGVISYGIYLWHLPIMATLLKLHHFGALALTVIASILAILVAAASYHFVEAPLIRLVRSRTG